MGDKEANRLNALGQKADVIPMRFIESGLVHYDDVGTVLVRKETLDKMAQSFIGRPVFNEQHQETSSKDFSSGRADGVVTRVWYDPSDAWFWADVAIWDPETKENCRNGYSLSCAYDVSQWSESGGIHNNIPYAREVLDGEYTHLAIVPNPRYEGARIIYNSNGGNMKIAFWKKEGDKPEVRNASEIDSDKATLTIDGKDVPVGQLVELWNAKEKERSAQQAIDALKNASDSDLVELPDGTKVSIGNLKTLVNTRKNGDMKKTDCSKCDGTGDMDGKKCSKCDGTGVWYVANESEKEKDDEERKNAEEKEKKDKEDEERKNAEKEEKDEKEKKERENASHFNRVKDLSNSRNGNFEAPKVLTPVERLVEGAKRYGSAK